MKYKVIALLAVVVLSGCATQQNRDPWEGYNRAVFKFNQVTYDYALIPMAKGYDYVVPDQVQLGIDNAYNNILEPGRIANDLLQWNFDYVWRDTARFVANTIFGVFGLFDVAKNMGLPRRVQNFGFTMAKWGYRYSPYFVVPILGPNTFGGSAGDLVDTVFNPLSYNAVAPRLVSWSAYGVYKANEGVQYLSLYEKLMNSSIDPYVAARNAYLQNYDYNLDKTLQIKPSNTAKTQHFDSDAEVLDLLDQPSN
ncbi:VacJ family lipoprotein [Cysteiniphilum sp. QT6929]|uniref:MlaA family lipoprotein n=1 Tax=Cysteiniphilum sp. QT6929 TaxID=2975055 RepID=UPI0024B3A5D6|nr:VacJ family lipoprotein [Cysteiniphilum sp. QT6929]WHN65423.1 VacJ family lipoprotein [Cysteiniphilum sp. QT6929]